MRENTLPTITASEINQHAFCARSWWLERVKGYSSAHMQEIDAGQAAHLTHGRLVMRYRRMRQLAYTLLFIAMIVGLLGLSARGW